MKALNLTAVLGLTFTREEATSKAVAVFFRRHVAGAEHAIAARADVVRNHDVHLHALATLHSADEVPSGGNERLTLILERRSRNKLRRLATSEKFVGRVAVARSENAIHSLVWTHTWRKNRSRI